MTREVTAVTIPMRIKKLVKKGICSLTQSENSQKKSIRKSSSKKISSLMILIRFLERDDSKMHLLTRKRWMKTQSTESKLIITYLTKTCFKMKKKLKMEKEDLLMTLLTID